jgi:hypothetical protein
MAASFCALLQTGRGNATPPLTPQQIDAEADRGVKTFLKAFARKG